MRPEDEILKLANSVTYGSVNFEVKRYDGQTVGVVGGVTESFKPDSDVKAYEYIIGLLKSAQGRERGSLTFTVVYDKTGHVKRVVTQNYETRNWEIKKK